MKAFILKTLCLAFVVFAAFMVWALSIRAPLRAEYWVRDMIVVKKHMLNELPSPRIIMFGGSSVMFAFDAVKMERELKVSTLNFGLHAGLRLEFILNLARSQAKPGDIVLLPLEHVYYTDFYKQWTSWQLRNAIGWDDASLQALSVPQRVVVYYNAFSGDILHDILLAKYDSFYNPVQLAPRLRTPQQAIDSHYAGKRDQNFAYEYIDARGSTQGAVEAKFNGPSVAWDQPDKVYPMARDLLKPFIEEMKAKGVTVYFAQPPYLIDGKTYTGYEVADAEFHKQIKELGSEVIDNRSQVCFARDMFFDTQGHLNVRGRELRTQVVIDALRPRLKALGLPKDPPALAPLP